ncbi:ABC transporter ATP-binding protein [Thalassomonas actiniarum]|uniref:ABC transporter ATP-binding protein n=1 Tax=Thalassomonas actiniarum TaxID=485447 RepID=A0AAE9YW73_9GAMM|nr:ABC transporter ATP-binding protein [Thalassomonas actiniarum]WDE02316.1 ABC transporter ATP-binding protein [Thalassomonas actiniarum]
MAVVELQGISRSFELGNTRVTALDKLNLTLEKGEFVVLRGVSGSGKSTLLNLIGAMDAPDAGEVFIHGQALSSLSDKQKSQLRSRYIGFIFQAFNLIPVLTALENVQYPLSLQKVPDREAKARAAKALAQVGLADFVDRRPNQLSGGQMQRVAIARALVTNPDIILADEPTANLDSETSKQIMDLLGSLNRETGVTFLFATHHDFVLSRASRVLELKDGHIVKDEQPHNLTLVENSPGEKLG